MRIAVLDWAYSSTNPIAPLAMPERHPLAATA